MIIPDDNVEPYFDEKGKFLGFRWIVKDNSIQSTTDC